MARGWAPSVGNVRPREGALCSIGIISSPRVEGVGGLVKPPRSWKLFWCGFLNCFFCFCFCFLFFCGETTARFKCHGVHRSGCDENGQVNE